MNHRILLSESRPSNEVASGFLSDGRMGLTNPEVPSKSVTGLVAVCIRR